MKTICTQCFLYLHDQNKCKLILNTKNKNKYLSSMKYSVVKKMLK